MECDGRSLAVARLLLAILLLVDLGQRWSLLAAHYSDSGVLPRTLLLRTCWNSAWFSWTTLSGHGLGLQLFFLAFLASILSFALGYHTEWSTCMVWVCLVSIQNRNPLILDSADTFLRLVLFWMIFLPLGTRWSRDAKRARGAPEHAVTWLASLALTLQISLMMGLALGSGMGSPSTGMAALLMVATLALWYPWDRGGVRSAGVMLLTATSALVGVQSDGQGFFFTVAACSAVALLPAWWWEGPWASVARRWSLPSGSVERQVRLGEIGAPKTARTIFGLLVLWVFVMNGVALTQSSRITAEPWVPAMMFLRLDTPAPGPIDLSPLTFDSGQFVMEGTRRDGTTLKRADVVESSFDLSHRRWRNYLTSLKASGTEPLRNAYGEFLCRKRSASAHSLQGLTEVKVSFVRHPRGLKSHRSTQAAEEFFLEYRMRRAGP